MFSQIFSAASGSSLGTLFVRLTADATDLVRGMERASTTMERSCAAMLAQVKNLAAGITGAMAIIGAVAVNEARKFEDSFAGVRKTVQATEEEYAKMEQAFRSLSKQIPINVNEINRVAEAAGQLGIANENIVGFTKVMIEMGTTTNMSADEAASSLARLANITQMNQKEFDRLGSTLVALGYNSAATESEIIDMSLRIAGAGTQIGMTEAQILSFAAGLSSVGIQAEMGGSAISQTMIQMAKAVTKGGDTLNTFAGIAGMTSEKFQAAFKDNAAEAVLKFVEGLNEVSKMGGDVFGVLDQLGIDGIRMTDLLLRASGAGDLFRKTMEVGNQAWSENTALVEAAEKRYQTFSSQLTITWNIFKDFLITIGQELMPVLKALNNMFQDTMRSQEDSNSTFSKFIDDIGPGFLFIVGLIGDAIWGWKLIIKAGEVGFLALFRAVIAAAQGFANLIAKIMEGVANSVVKSLNFMIRSANKLLPEDKEIKEIKWKLKLDMSGLDTPMQIMTDSLNQAWDEMNAIVDEGSFSSRLQKEYEKVTKTVTTENAKIVEDTKKTATAAVAELAKIPAGPSQMEKDSAFALRTMSTMKMPEEGFGTTRGLRQLEDPNLTMMKNIAAELQGAQDNIKVLEELGAKDLQLSDEVQQKKLKMLEAYNAKAGELQRAQAELALSVTTTMFGDLTHIAEMTAGKQSGIYKTMFAATKAFAIAESIIKIQQGIAAASSLPFPSNLAAIGSVVAATSSIISTIQSTQLEFGGGRALGGPVNPGSYYKVGEEGEELFAPSVPGTIIPNDKLGGGSNVKVIINNHTDAQAEVKETQQGDERVIEVMIKRTKEAIANEIRDGRGDVNRAMSETFNLRRGR